jgi:hypothetical protein
MKYLILALFMAGCATAPKAYVPKHRSGDCVGMTAMTMTKDGGWDSTGYDIVNFQIVDVVTTDKMNIYMAKRLHAKVYYKISIIEDKYEKFGNKGLYVIPAEDVDNFRYASVMWYPEGTRNGVTCNSYSKDKK